MAISKSDFLKGMQKAKNYTDTFFYETQESIIKNFNATGSGGVSIDSNEDAELLQQLINAIDNGAGFECANMSYDGIAETYFVFDSYTTEENEANHTISYTFNSSSNAPFTITGNNQVINVANGGNNTSFRFTNQSLKLKEEYIPESKDDTYFIEYKKSTFDTLVNDGVLIYKESPYGGTGWYEFLNNDLKIYLKLSSADYDNSHYGNISSKYFYIPLSESILTESSGRGIALKFYDFDTSNEETLKMWIYSLTKDGWTYSIIEAPTQDDESGSNSNELPSNVLRIPYDYESNSAIYHFSKSNTLELCDITQLYVSFNDDPTIHVLPLSRETANGFDKGNLHISPMRAVTINDDTYYIYAYYNLGKMDDNAHSSKCIYFTISPNSGISYINVHGVLSSDIAIIDYGDTKNQLIDKGILDLFTEVFTEETASKRIYLRLPGNAPNNDDKNLNTHQIFIPLEYSELADWIQGSQDSLRFVRACCYKFAQRLEPRFDIYVYTGHNTDTWSNVVLRPVQYNDELCTLNVIVNGASNSKSVLLKASNSTTTDIDLTDIIQRYTNTLIDNALSNFKALPEVTTENNGNTLIANNGQWTIGMPDSLPKVTEADNGKFMMVANGQWTVGTSADISATPYAEEVEF